MPLTLGVAVSLWEVILSTVPRRGNREWRDIRASHGHAPGFEEGDELLLIDNLRAQLLRLREL